MSYRLEKEEIRYNITVMNALDTQIVRLRISLADIEPEIWRVVEVPLDMSLKGVHDVIQAVMGWQDKHLFEFRVSDKCYGLPDPDDIEFGRRLRNARFAKLRALLEVKSGDIEYIYDFGDYWKHNLAVDAVEPVHPGRTYPRLVDGGRRSPPEDVGGPSGYHKFLDAISNPRHRHHRRALDWHCEPYDPGDIGLLAIHLRLSKIARRRHAGRHRKRHIEGTLT